MRAGVPLATSYEEVNLVTSDDNIIDELSRTSMHWVRGDSIRELATYYWDLLTVEHHCPTKPTPS